MDNGDHLTLEGLAESNKSEHQEILLKISAMEINYKKIEPIINTYYNDKIIKLFLLNIGKGFVIILGVLATIGAIATAVYKIFVEK